MDGMIRLTPRQIRYHSKVICFFGATPHHLLERFLCYQRGEEGDDTKIDGIELRAVDYKLGWDSGWEKEKFQVGRS